MVVPLAGGDQGVPPGGEYGIRKRGENPVAVGLFDCNDDEVIPPLTNAGIF
jgi:hypothetical protein